MAYVGVRKLFTGLDRVQEKQQHPLIYPQTRNGNNAINANK